MSEKELTPQEKQRETRRKHKEAQKQREAERTEERELIRRNLKAVLESDEATPRERLECSKLLLEMNKDYY